MKILGRTSGRALILRWAVVLPCFLAAACGKASTGALVSPAAANTPPANTRAVAGDAAIADLGRRIFHDPALSASGRISCATCHSPDHAYGPPNGLAVQLGGPKMDRQGMRAVPTLRYVLNRTPVWSKEFVNNPAERIMDGDSAPTGGFGWDGRFDSLRAQAAFPLLAVNEMANRDPAEVISRLRQRPYADAFREAFGENIFEDSQRAFANATYAIERFELDDPDFHPYDSKFDLYLDGKLELSRQELRGRELFDDRTRGNCASCHPDQKGADGSHPLFTDYQFEALGVPRNPEIRANVDPGYFDAGLCGPLRKDQVSQTQFCGLFKTPTLRNVASRQVFFHNGRFHSLKEALRFYVRRDTDPGRWYPAFCKSGTTGKFNDLLPDLRGNVDVIDLPLTRKRGEQPVWSDREIDDVVAFLETLNDGYGQRLRLAESGLAKYDH